jgi:Right handed beta helix region
MRRGLSLFLLSGSIVLAIACGGGGGGSGGGGSRADVLYVRADVGDDANTGATVDEAFASIARAVGLATDGDMIIVGPGTYGSVSFDQLGGNSRQPVLLLADESGAMTTDPPGPVIVDGGQNAFGFRLTHSSYVTIDGFQFVNATGANGAGVHVRSSSDHVIVRHCVVRANRDGIRVQASDDVLLFDNLIVQNTNRGLRIADGSDRIQVVNNTIADNNNQGIVLGDEGQASIDAYIHNNIIQENRNRNIFVTTGTVPPSSLDGYNANYDLVFSNQFSGDQTDGYRPITIIGVNDINENAQFVGADDYHLRQTASPALDASDPNLDPEFVTALGARSTSPDGTPDQVRIDLGYHFPILP